MKNLKTRLRLLFVLGLTTVVYLLQGQGWQKNYPNTDAIEVDLIVTPDGGFLTACWGESVAFKTDENGNLQWSVVLPDSLGNTYGGSVANTSDGNYLIVGGAFVDNPTIYDFYTFAIKVDPSGNILWLKLYPFGRSYRGQSVALANDGGFFIGNQRKLLMKTDSIGTPLWVNTNVGAEALVATSDGGVIMLAYDNLASDPKAYFYKFSETGDSVWMKTSQLANGKSFIAKGMDATADGGFVILGGVSTPNIAAPYDHIVEKYNANGIKQWATIIGTSQTEGGNNIAHTQDGGYIIAGWKGGHEATLWRLNPQGYVLWDKGYFWSSEGLSVREVSNGDFIMLTQGLRLVRTDAQGNSFQNKIIGTLVEDLNRDCQHQPGEQGLAGWSVSVSVNGFPEFIGTTDFNGNFDIEVGTGNYEIDFWPPTNYHEPCQPGLSANLSTSPTIFDLGTLPALAIDTTTVNVSGPVFQDLDGDCAYDPGEPLLSNVQVGIRSEFGDVNLTQFTDSNGNYSFDVPPGDYYGVAIISSINNPYCVPCCIDFCNYNFLDGSTPITYNLGMTCNVPAPQLLTGFIFFDENENCQPDLGEPGVQNNWILKLVKAGTQDSFLIDPGPVNSGGNFSVQVDTGTYYLTVTPPNNLYIPCLPVQTVTVSLSGAPTVYIPIMTLADCPSLSVDITTSLLRPCLTNNYVVQYCNQGTMPAEDAYVRVTLPSALSYVASALPATALPGNVWEFQIGDVPVGYCGGFWLTTLLDCNEPIGLTYCAEAHIFPDSLCGPQNVQWDGSSVELSADCVGDSVVLSISNAGWGDMGQPLNFIVVEDNVLIKDSTFQLPAGGMTNVTVYPNGATIVLSAQQANGHPSASMPLVFVEGCGGDSISLGFVSQYPMPDNDDFIAIDCRESVNSFDPNTKEAQPKGVTDAHFIENATDLSYQITFQNLGTAPAETVVILDTLSQFLDTARLELGAASHPYEFELLPQNVLKFTFPNIQLPQASQDPDGSIGFVKFRVKQRPGNLPGTVITNRAAIYFDNNPAVITPEVFHTIPYPVMTKETNLSLCAGESWSGVPITADTAIVDTVKYAFFDSVFVTNINVLPTASVNISATICNNETYSFGDLNYSQSGIYTKVFAAQNGCDSMVTLNLAVLPAIASETAATICAGETYAFGNESYSQTGIYSHVFAAQNGCDSTVTLNLTVLPPANFSINGTLCFGESIVVNGTVFDASNPLGTVVFPDGSFHGCDSTINVSLVFLPNASSEISATICEGDTYELNGETYNMEGTYTQVLSAENDCDSTVQLTLNLLPLLALQVDTMALPGAEIFGVVVNSDTVFTQSYMDENGCVERTVNVQILTATKPDGRQLQYLAISPNPANGSFTLSGSLTSGSICEAKLLDAYGRTVLQLFENEWLAGEFSRKVDLEEIPVGMYFFSFSLNGERQTTKLVVGGR